MQMYTIHIHRHTLKHTHIHTNTDTHAYLLYVPEAHTKAGKDLGVDLPREKWGQTQSRDGSWPGETGREAEFLEPATALQPCYQSALSGCCSLAGWSLLGRTAELWVITLAWVHGWRETKGDQKS